MSSDRITWLASYPKSGNTWVRCLLQAYRSNGYLNINDLYTGIGDSSVSYTRSICPVSVSDLGRRGQWLLRPAALLNAVMAARPPIIFKTHYANLTAPGLSAFIPREFTEKALYMVRDPRSVALSLSDFLSLSLPKTVSNMAHKEFIIGHDDRQIPTLVSSWTNHVRSWCSEKAYPIHVIKYEDLLEDPLGELKDIVEFFGFEYNEPRAKRAVNAAKLSKLRKVEIEKGFSEYADSKFDGQFFNKGGSRWQDELGQKWIAKIEKDHGKLMRELGYL